MNGYPEMRGSLNPGTVFSGKSQNFAHYGNLIQVSGPVILVFLLICLIYLSKVTCDAPRHCCQNGDGGCEGRCIPESWIDDGDKDCDNGSDEKGNTV